MAGSTIYWFDVAGQDLVAFNLIRTTVLDVEPIATSLTQCYLLVLAASTATEVTPSPDDHLNSTLLSMTSRTSMFNASSVAATSDFETEAFGNLELLALRHDTLDIVDRCPLPAVFVNGRPSLFPSPIDSSIACI